MESGAQIKKHAGKSEELSAREEKNTSDDLSHLRQGHRARLRQRFLQSEGEAVADYEILELLLFGVIARRDVKPLAKKLLRHFGSLGKICHASPELLARDFHLGMPTIALLKAVFHASQLMLREEVAQRPLLSSWNRLVDYLVLRFKYLQVEEFHLLFLDTKNRLISDECQQKGTVNQTSAYPREVVRRALDLGASALVVAHNHPSGDPSPSRADISLTQKLQAALQAVDIRLHDHLVFGHNEHVSFRNLGLLD